ncbi:hypothetical protein SCUP515_05933 [Seiridium cupressi]
MLGFLEGLKPILGNRDAGLCYIHASSVPVLGKSSSKHGSRHDGKSSRSKHAESSASSPGKGKSSSRSRDDYNANFLFVVNELNLNPEYPPAADRWGNIIPPETPNGYAQETVGQVFRYRNGRVTLEEIYIWYRPDLGDRGDIGYWTQDTDEAGNALPVFNPLTAYSTFSIFNCGPFLPCVYGIGDVSEDQGDFDGCRALHFHHTGGVSQASPNGSCKYVAGRNASFIDGLISAAYRNVEAHAPRSTGLGGEVGLIIGCMALSQSPGTVDRPTSVQDPRGVLVHIALDPSGDLGTSAEEISDFEWYGISVAG